MIQLQRSPQKPGTGPDHLLVGIFSLVTYYKNRGKSIKVFAEELGGKDFISFNYYLTSGEHQLKPCEMPTEKVLHFLFHFEQLDLS